MIESFFTKMMAETAWMMEPPKPYGSFHLAFFFFGFMLSAFAAYRLRNISERGCRRVVFSVGLFLLFIEVYKQCFYYFYIGEGEYPWWVFPFQLCSVPMYLCLIAPLLKPGRLQKGMYYFLVYYNMLGGIAAYLEPSGMISDYLALTLHSFSWHLSLVFLGMFLIATGNCGLKLRDYFSATGCYLVLCVIAFSLNLILRKPSGGSINMFFIGPNVSPLIVIRDIGARFGWYVGTAVYIPAVCLGAFVVFSVIRFAKKRLAKKRLEKY